MFISFEGIDGSGKTTQAKLIYDELRKNHKCVLTREPTQGDIGNFVKKLIKRKKINPMAAQLLFAADRSFHLENLIKPKLKSNNIVVTDRYYLSTIAYGKASGLNESWLELVNSRFLKPDITFVFDIDPKVAIRRIESRRKGTAYFEKLKFLKTTRNVYRRLARQHGCYMIDGSQDIETIKELLLLIIKHHAPIV
ncbi:dTMP kinase [Candidatus Marsarchaeota archaeon]|nr:dTMP kinase [Candidatus Marsarchaeota archaeon]